VALKHLLVLGYFGSENYLFKVDYIGKLVVLVLNQSICLEDLF
jgi:hypothetical protein